MAKKEVEERELSKDETATAIIIMLLALWILGNATEVCRVVIALTMMIGDLVLIYQAKYSVKKGG